MIQYARPSLDALGLLLQRAANPGARAGGLLVLGLDLPSRRALEERVVREEAADRVPRLLLPLGCARRLGAVGRTLAHLVAHQPSGVARLWVLLFRPPKTLAHDGAAEARLRNALLHQRRRSGERESKADDSGVQHFGVE